MLEYLKYGLAAKSLWDNKEIIIGCTYITCTVIKYTTKTVYDTILEGVSHCKCSVCDEKRKRGEKSDH